MRVNRLLVLLATGWCATLHAQRSPFDSANARAATDDYARSGRARVVHAGTYEMVPFGHVQPKLVCAPLRICTAELQRGERVLDHALADPQRWVVEIAVGPDSTPVVVAKPVGLPNACDLTTNLLVTTTRRIYHFTLDSPPCGRQAGSTNPDMPYTAQIKFYYPDESLVTHHADVVAPDAGAAAVHGGDAEPLAVRDLESVHLDYEVIPDRRFPWRPTAVFDNGSQTCIRVPAEAYHGELATLYAVNPSGGYEMVQYLVRDGCFVTDRVMQRMVLLIPSGAGDPLRLLIVRRETRGKR